MKLRKVGSKTKIFTVFVQAKLLAWNKNLYLTQHVPSLIQILSIGIGYRFEQQYSCSFDAGRDV